MVEVGEVGAAAGASAAKSVGTAIGEIALGVMAALIAVRTCCASINEASWNSILSFV